MAPGEAPRRPPEPGGPPPAEGDTEGATGAGITARCRIDTVACHSEATFTIASYRYWGSTLLSDHDVPLLFTVAHQERLAVQWDFGDIPRGAPAALLHFPPPLRGAPEVAGLLCTPEGPALDIPEASLALGFSQRHKAPFEGVPRRHRVA